MTASSVVPTTTTTTAPATRRCTECRETKPLPDFPHNKNDKAGHGYYCRPCNRKRTKAYAAAHREQYRAGIEAAHRKQFAGKGLVNQHWISGDTVYIEAFDGQGNRHVGMIDLADLPAVKAIDARWLVTPAGYLQAANFTGVDEPLLHRALIGVRTSRKLHTDHISGNRLDNRRSNLRIVPAAINNLNRTHPHPRNTSGYRGVREKDGQWIVQIHFNGQTIYRGFGDDYLEACRFARNTYISLGVPSANLPPLPLPAIGRAA